MIVYQDGQGQVHVSAMDPQGMLGMIDNPEVTPVTTQARALLQEALEAV